MKRLEANNAAYLANYFPPQTFTTQAKDFRNQWYSRTLYSMGEQPLWPPESTSLAAYRITVIPAFFGPTTVTLQVLPDGTGRLTLKKLDWKTQSLEVQKSLPVAQDDVEKFLNRLNRADYWRMPAESSFRGLDGETWMLEGVHNGEYHLVTRWCPDIDPQSQEKAFAEAARGLFKLAGQKL